MKTIGMIINDLILDNNIGIDVLCDFLMENKILNKFLNTEIYFEEDIDNIRKECEKVSKEENENIFNNIISNTIDKYEAISFYNNYKKEFSNKTKEELINMCSMVGLNKYIIVKHLEYIISEKIYNYNTLRELIIKLNNYYMFYNIIW